jgi:acetoin:2,6-dichlorophenolindophenol oxidoreductase subunit alpha
MRSSSLNVPEAIPATYPADLSLDIFERMCLVRYFELGIINAVEKKEITCAVYLSSGQESVAAALSLAIGDYLIYPQHRCHDIYLAFGGPPEMLRDELMGLPSGTSQGKAGSNCIQYHGKDVSMFGHHGFIGENVPLAVGAAMGSGRKVVCFFGDGAAEEDYVLAAMGYAATYKLPVLFVCIDNGLSILTPTDVRRTWSITEVAKSFGMPAIDLADDPWAVTHHAEYFGHQLPALMNCTVCRAYWHVGVGNDGPPQWDRYYMVRDTLVRMGLEAAVDAIEEKTRNEMTELWNQELLLRPLTP